MTDPKRTLWYLKKIQLLAELGPEVLARLAERVEMREVRRRDVVYLPGDPGKSIFFVNGGRVKICTRSALPAAGQLSRGLSA